MQSGYSSHVIGVTTALRLNLRTSPWEGIYTYYCKSFQSPMVSKIIDPRENVMLLFNRLVNH